MKTKKTNNNERTNECSYLSIGFFDVEDEKNEKNVMLCLG